MGLLSIIEHAFQRAEHLQRMQAVRDLNRDRFREYGRRHYAKNRDAILARAAERRMKDPEADREYQRRYNEAHPGKKRMANDAYDKSDKGKARRAVNNAVHRGTMTKPTVCEMCGGEFTKNRIHGHHDSYDEDRRLVVTWVCTDCHGFIHRRDFSREE